MPVFSHSRLSSFENCPLQYRLRYVDEIEIDRRETVESFVGHQVHRVLQYLHDRLLDGIVLTEAEVLASLRAEWRRDWHAGIHIVRTENLPDDYLRIAERCVRGYYRTHAPFDGDGTIGTEIEVLFMLDESRDIQIRGYVDRLSKTVAGVYEIHDYKTSRRLPTQADVDRDRQLALYQLAIQARHPDAREVRLVWHFLAHGRTLVSVRTPGALERLKRETLAAIARVARATEANEFPANRSKLCDWCDYRPVCPAWNPVQESLFLAGERA